MVVDVPRARRPSVPLTILLVVALLVVGYGEGIALGIQTRFGLASPWIVTFPLIVMMVAAYAFLTRKGLAAADVFQIEVVLWMFALGLLLQLLLHDNVYVAGYVQLAIFVVALAVVRGLVARAPVSLVRALGPAVLVAHLFLCGYVLATWLGWRLGGLDLSVKYLIDPSTQTPLNAYYGFRPAAWSTEPAGAALALSVSYIAVHYLVPSARTIALVVVVVAAVAVQSVTLLVFLSFVTCVLLFRRATRLATFSSVVLAVTVLLVVTSGTFGWSRVDAVIQGRDPSTMMRSSSVFVGIDVLSRSFPLGVGYGNFRDQAVYGPEFASFIDLSTASFYKTDVLLLNFAAELGLGGILIIAYVFRMLGFGRLLLPTIFLAMQAVLAGTLLVPALLVLAAVMGSHDQLRRPEQTQIAPDVETSNARPMTPGAFVERSAGGDWAHRSGAPKTGSASLQQVRMRGTDCESTRA